MKCTQCGKCHNNKLDPDFCRSCYDKTERMMERNVMMNRASAAKAFLAGQFDTLHYRQMEVKAFLSIIEPRMSEKRRLEIMRAVK